ncbi:MAG: bifunctional riboflavin kinase/FAD synthetase [Luteibaculaceae bacterium]
MQVFERVSDFKLDGPIVLTTGTFDGVHLGHKVIIDRIVQLAKNTGGRAVLLSFTPHPRKVLFPETQSFKLLTTKAEKVALLKQAGLDAVIMHPFTPAFAATTAKEFVEELLVKQIGVSQYVIGYDHQFGKNREGSLENLQKLAPKLGFTVEEIPAHEIDQLKISSTKIRQALVEGNIALANQLLGYQYSISGIVVEGEKLGRQLGFPTANLAIQDPDKLIPSNGVYAVWAKVGNKRWPAVMNLGNKPTVSNQENVQPIPEVHIINFSHDIYHTEIQVFFVSKLRNEQKFENLEQLKQQISKDKIEAQSILY